MILKEYLDTLQTMVKENPDLLDCLVVYAEDSEGNGFDTLHFTPSVGMYDIDDKEFIPEIYFDEYEGVDMAINAICIN